MRYNEHMNQPEKVEKSKKEKEEPRILAGNRDYDYENLYKGKKPPLKGGNSYGR